MLAVDCHKLDKMRWCVRDMGISLILSWEIETGS